MQRISESAESLFGDLHKPFSTASVKGATSRFVRAESVLASTPDIGEPDCHVSVVPILLQKYF
jgi:hypothetical protein